MLEPSDIIRIFIANSLGESVLVETLRSAAYYITCSTTGFRPKHHRDVRYLREAGNCYYFVQGTGLDILIERFNLEYDPETLREGFNYYLRHAS